MQKGAGKTNIEKQLVGEKVSRTKKEIEELKAQLQKLISDGLKKPPEPATTIDVVPAPIKEQLPRPTKFSPSNKQKLSESTTKKTFNYDRDAAREYIKKQKERRKELMKDKRSKVDLTQDLRKQRLHELRQKSLQLVSKSIKKKREPVLLCDEIQSVVETAMVASLEFKPIELPPRIHKNITVRSPEFNVSPPLLPLAPSTLQNRAATKIQAAFRGYRQRKLYQLLLKKRSVSKQVQTNNTVWLDTPTTPHPYNLLNAVKRKLNLAFPQNRPNTTDVSVQAEGTRCKSVLSNLGVVKSVIEDHADSDTSKNIPDISSESSSSKCLHFSENLKVRDQIQNVDQSIISYNKCGYSKLHSELKVPNLNLLELELEPIRMLPVVVESLNEGSSDKSSGCVSNKAQSSSKKSISITSDLKAKSKHVSNASSVTSTKSNRQSSNVEYSSRFNSNQCEIDAKVVDKLPFSRSLRQSSATLETKSGSSLQNGIKTASEYSTHFDSGGSTASVKHSNFVFDDRLLGLLENGAIFEQQNCIHSQSSCLNVETRTDTTEGKLDVLSLKAPNVRLRCSSVSLSNESDNDSVRLKSDSSHNFKDNDVSKREFGSDVDNPIKVLNPGETTIKNKMKTNEIHFKFEAELHLLNEFNESLQQVMAIEKSLVELHNNPTTFQTRDTQTSIITTKTSTLNQHPVSTINYSRGCDLIDDTTTSFIMSGLELSQIKDSLDNTKENNESITPYLKDKLKNINTQAGLSIDMFEQLIKDEDARIDNLKAILKIREKSLVDRTKGELAWLEVQKRHLRDSGQIQEISAIKKKQRGLLIKLEHERHEMQRLKQMQKAASRERILVLKEQRNNMIKGQLSTCNSSTKIKRGVKEHRRASGPLKVYNIKSCSESIMSETTISRQSSIIEEVVSHSQSVVSHVIEEVEASSCLNNEKNVVPVGTEATVETECVKQTLLMREAALHKRRKTAEELLQWHQRLLEEEEKITQLELAAVAIINQIPVVSDNSKKHKFKGSQLNLLWHNMTGRAEHKFDDSVCYLLSKTALHQFCKDAKKCVVGGEFVKAASSGGYSSDFEAVSAEIAIEIKQKDSGFVNVEDTTIDEDLSGEQSDVNKITSKHNETLQIQTSDDPSNIEGLEQTSDTEKIDEISERFGEIIDANSETNSNPTKSTVDTTATSNCKATISKSETTDIQETATDTESRLTVEQLTTDRASETTLEETNDGDDIVPNKTESVKEQCSFLSNKHNNCSTKNTDDSKMSNTETSEINNDNNIHNVTSVHSHTQNVQCSFLENKTENPHSTTNEASETIKTTSNALSKTETKDETAENNNTIETSENDNSQTLDEVLNASELAASHSKISSTAVINSYEEIATDSGTVSDSSENNKRSMTNKHIVEETSNIDESPNSVLISYCNSLNKVKTNENSYTSITINKNTQSDIITDAQDIETTNSNDEIGTISFSKSKLSKHETAHNEISIPNGLQKSLISSSNSFIHSSTNNLDVELSNATDHMKSSKCNTSQIIQKASDIQELRLVNIQEPSNSKDTSAIQESLDNQRSTIIQKSSHIQKSSRVKEPPDVQQLLDVYTTSSNNLSKIACWNNIATNNESTIKTLQSSKIMSRSAKTDNQIADSHSPIKQINDDFESHKLEETNSKERKLTSTNDYDDTFDNTSKIDVTLSYDNLPLEPSKVETKTSTLENNIITVENVQTSELGEDDSQTSDQTDHSINTLMSEEATVSFDESFNIHANSDNAWTDVESSEANNMISDHCNKEESIATNKENISDELSSCHTEIKLDVKKRVSEILTDANILSPRSDKIPRLQDLYVTTYDVVDDEIKDGEVSPVKQIDEEVQQLLKKQLEIENEIKKIQQQQQKEQLPYLYVREIPNKPPPPYTPPVTTLSQSGSVLPANEKHLASITTTITSILHSAHTNNNLHNVTLSPEYKHQTSFEFIFDLCREAALEHYKQFDNETGQPWMKITKQTKLALGKPFMQNELNSFLFKKMKQLLGYESIKSAENFKRKWSSKKRDHVDELLIVECQEEEADWVNYDKDELVVKDELCKDLMNMLVSETAQVFSSILNKKTFLY